MLGIAKLLLPIVHVKRETPYVVSSTMTGLMPSFWQDFHITCKFTVSGFPFPDRYPSRCESRWWLGPTAEAADGRLLRRRFATRSNENSEVAVQGDIGR